MWLVPLAESTAACGGKARGLERLIAAGLPVPAGWVLDDRAFRAAAGELQVADAGAIGHALAAAAARLEASALPAELVDEVAARAHELGLLAVRSSATIEDGEAGAAAGVFVSRVAVRPEEVWPAIRAVWASALAPLAVGYARSRGEVPAIAVILQRHVPGELVTVYTRPPGAPDADEVWVQRGAALAKHRRDGAAGGEQSGAGGLDRGGRAIVELALAAEHAIGAPRGADVELVIGDPDGAEPAWVVQARPIVHPARRAPVAPPEAVTAALVADGRRWTWDVAHNPDPLSVAQASLVERVEHAGVSPWSMRVCAGYLYTTPRSPPIRAEVANRAELEERASELERRIAAALDDGGDGGGGDPAASVDAAIERYLAFYAIWSREVVPLIAAARAHAPAVELRGARPSAIEAALLAAARGEQDEAGVIARFGAQSPAWDIAVPTFGERPEILRDAIARARLLAPTDGAAPPERDDHDHRDDLARAGADLAERDDLWFAQAQWLVRRALLVRAAALGLPPGDAFWLPLDELTGPGTLSIVDAHRRASAARTAATRAAHWSMPLVIGGTAAPAAAPLQGLGTGGRVTGRVKRFASLAQPSLGVAVGRGDVVVTRAVTPALAVFVMGCAALVSETGGLLDHGASLARELGIACVVGCREAWTLLDDGMIVTVDGDAGTVVIDEG